MSGSACCGCYGYCADRDVVLGEWQDSAGRQQLTHVRGAWSIGAAFGIVLLRCHGDISSPGHTPAVCSVWVLVCARLVQPSPASWAFQYPEWVHAWTLSPLLAQPQAAPLSLLCGVIRST